MPIPVAVFVLIPAADGTLSDNAQSCSHVRKRKPPCGFPRVPSDRCHPRQSVSTPYSRVSALRLVASLDSKSSPPERIHSFCLSLQQHLTSTTRPVTPSHVHDMPACLRTRLPLEHQVSTRQMRCSKTKCHGSRSSNGWTKAMCHSRILSSAGEHRL